MVFSIIAMRYFLVKYIEIYFKGIKESRGKDIEYNLEKVCELDKEISDG